MEMPSTKSTSHVKYTGPASVKSLAKADFEAKGITDQDDVEFNHDNKWVNEVSPEAAGLLIGLGDFEKVSKADADKLQNPEEEPVQQVPAPGETIPGERPGAHAPYPVQDQPDSQKKS
jgi:hypothetical protein